MYRGVDLHVQGCGPACTGMWTCMYRGVDRGVDLHVQGCRQGCGPACTGV